MKPTQGRTAAGYGNRLPAWGDRGEMRGHGWRRASGQPLAGKGRRPMAGPELQARGEWEVIGGEEGEAAEEGFGLGFFLVGGEIQEPLDL